MRKLPEVEQAKALMTEAAGWSVMRWLREKKRVRKAADEANAALDELNRKVKARWSHDVKAAYDQLSRPMGAGQKVSQSNSDKKAAAPNLAAFIGQVQEADDKANRARMEAERTFDEAERVLSTSLAREGCKKAIHSWDLHEEAIHHAEKLLAT
jgi:hypothetical protein